MLSEKNFFVHYDFRKIKKISESVKDLLFQAVVLYYILRKTIAYNTF